MALIRDKLFDGTPVVTADLIHDLGYRYIDPQYAFMEFPANTGVYHHFFIDQQNNPVWLRCTDGVHWETVLANILSLNPTAYLEWVGINCFQGAIHAWGRSQFGGTINMTFIMSGSILTAEKGAVPSLVGMDSLGDGSDFFTSQQITNDASFGPYHSGYSPQATTPVRGVATPYFNIVNDYSTFANFTVGSTGDLRNGISIFIRPIYQLLAPSSTVGEGGGLLYQCICPTDFDPSLLWSGQGPGLVGDPHPVLVSQSDGSYVVTYVMSNFDLEPVAFDPASGALVPDDFFPSGNQQLDYSGFRDNYNWTGTTHGSTYAGYYSNAAYRSRGQFHPGYMKDGGRVVAQGPAVVVDREMAAPERKVVQGYIGIPDPATVGTPTPHQLGVGGTVVNTTFMVDNIGLLGSNFIGSNTSNEVDQTGIYSSFGRSRVYGSPNFKGTITDAWMPRTSATNLVAAITTSNGTSNVANPRVGNTLMEINHGCVYWFVDRLPFDRNIPVDVMLLSQAPHDEDLYFLPDPNDPHPGGTALGTQRGSQTFPDYSMKDLEAACRGEYTTLPNPNNSPGCSFILRALLDMSGFAYTITREVAKDGQANGHQGGNALDISAPLPDVDLTEGEKQAVRSQELSEITDLVRAIPELFAAAIYVDPAGIEQNSVYVYDGQIVGASEFPASLRKDAEGQLHIQSSKSRLLNAFQNKEVQATLGIIGTIAENINGVEKVTVALSLGAFNERWVYVNQDQYSDPKHVRRGIGVGEDSTKTRKVNFW